MNDGVDRRGFLRQCAAGFAGLAAAGSVPVANAQRKTLEHVRVGIVGVGGRGTSHVHDLVRIPQVEIKAVADIVASHAENAQNLVEKAGHPRPASYVRGETDYKRMCAEQDLDIVYIATPWQWHTPVAVEAMQTGKHAATEVPAATSLEECWQLVETSESTGRYAIMLENCCYDRVELMVLNMVRKGLLGDVVRAECGYLHDLRALKFSDEGEGLWRLNFSLRRNADIYPTHGLGPVAQTVNINRGNLFDYLVTVASKPAGLHQYAAEKFGADSPQAKLNILMGDAVSSLIRTVAGQSILVVHNTNDPRPYSRKFQVQGTRGLVEKYPNPVIYVEGRSPADKWEELLPATRRIGSTRSGASFPKARKAPDTAAWTT